MKPPAPVTRARRIRPCRLPWPRPARRARTTSKRSVIALDVERRLGVRSGRRTHRLPHLPVVAKLRAPPPGTARVRRGRPRSLLRRRAMVRAPRLAAGIAARIGRPAHRQVRIFDGTEKAPASGSSRTRSTSAAPSMSGRSSQRWNGRIRRFGGRALRPAGPRSRLGAQALRHHHDLGLGLGRRPARTARRGRASGPGCRRRGRRTGRRGPGVVPPRVVPGPGRDLVEGRPVLDDRALGARVDPQSSRVGPKSSVMATTASAGAQEPPLDPLEAVAERPGRRGSDGPPPGPWRCCRGPGARTPTGPAAPGRPQPERGLGDQRVVAGEDEVGPEAARPGRANRRA